MEIASTRIILRDFVSEDLAAFKKYHQDGRFGEFYAAEAGDTRFITALFHAFQQWSDETPRKNFQFAVVTRHNPDVVIGCCGIRTEGCLPGCADLGIELAPDYWGKYKYAIEILQALATFAFIDLGLSEIKGQTIDLNARIGKLANAFGATFEKIPSASWVRERGWQEIEWHLGKDRWQQSAL